MLGNLQANLLWQPLLEGTAQTLVGILGSYSIGKVVSNIKSKDTYYGAMDFWTRAIQNSQAQEGDVVKLDALISPYCQLFPGNPYDNATRYNSLYSFEDKIDSSEYQAMEFFAGSDAGLRLNSLNGESIIGIYSRYGYIGEGVVGIIPTKLLAKKIPNFFHSEFYGKRVTLKGVLSRCPAQHGFVAQGIAIKAGINIDVSEYKKLWYLDVKSISVFNSSKENITSLLGSPWAVTESELSQYLVQYGYISNSNELSSCVSRITGSKYWDKAKVFYDDIKTPSESLSFKKNFIG